MSWKSRKTSGSRGASGQRQRGKLGEGIAKERLLRFECLEVRRLLSLAPIISEIDPGNKSGIVDVKGNTADWLEIYNPDPTAAVNLSGWSLEYQKTGSGGSSTWNFPANTVLGPGEFRVVFCDSAAGPSTDPVGELDTGFNLSKDGATVTLAMDPAGRAQPSQRPRIRP